jgi:hypothetical protein
MSARNDSPRLLDLFSGRWGWSREFAARGWKCYGIDWQRPAVVPEGCEFILADVRDLSWPYSFLSEDIRPDFIVASSPCEEFTVWGMKNFHPKPPYPEMGIALFTHTRLLCHQSGLPYLMENVRAAQQFVGNAVAHAGSFYLWGTAVPALLPRGLTKGFTRAGGRYRAHENRSITPAEAATIPPALANCVAQYAERLIEVPA